MWFYFHQFPSAINEKFSNSIHFEYEKYSFSKRKDVVCNIERYAQNPSCKLYIITASVYDWVQPFFTDNRVTVIGTIVEYDENQRLTGRFLSKNCYGMEKVNRLKELEKDISDTFLIAYGDSKGDRELLRIANKAYYREPNGLKDMS